MFLGLSAKQALGVAVIVLAVSFVSKRTPLGQWF